MKQDQAILRQALEAMKRARAYIIDDTGAGNVLDEGIAAILAAATVDSGKLDTAAWPEWQPIETAPNNGAVLVAWFSETYNEWNLRSAHMLCGRAYVDGSPYSNTYPATHWKPQPAPPVEAEPE